MLKSHGQISIFNFSIFLGFIVILSFVGGCAVVIVVLQQEKSLSSTFHRIYEHFGLIAEPKGQPNDCNVCGLVKCNRHLAAPNREPWRGLFISQGLDSALDSVRNTSFSRGKLSGQANSTKNPLISVLYKDSKCIC